MPVQNHNGDKPSPSKFFFAALILILTVAGCGQKQASHTVLHHRTQADVLNYLDNYRPSVRTNGHQVNFDTFIDSILEKHVIYVAERHDRYDHHLNQLAVLRQLYAKNPKLSIGVEWLQQPFQDIVDQYIAGDISESELLKKTEYQERWGYDYRMLRPVLEFARTHNLPVIALNADADITRKTGKNGLASLSDEERSKLPETITLPSAEETETLRRIFDLHPDDGRKFENFITVQRIWDITMGENIVKHLEQYPDRTVVVFAGEGHLRKGIAIPAEVSKARPEASTAVVHSAIEAFEDHGDADYLILSLSKSLPPIGKMGIWLGDHKEGTLVEAVVEKSAADSAGLKKGDVITQLNGVATPGSDALKLAIAYYEPGDKVTVSVLRYSEAGSSKEQNFKLTLQ